MINELVIGGRIIKVLWVEGGASDALENDKLSNYHSINSTLTILNECTPEIRLVELTYYGLWYYLDETKSDIKGDVIRQISNGLLGVVSDYASLLCDNIPLPKELRIGPAKYTILHDNNGHGLGSGNIGEHIYYRGLITLRGELERNRKFLTLWHEITHAIDRFMSCEMTEQQVSMVAHGWVALMYQNPQLVELIKSTYHTVKDDG